MPGCWLCSRAARRRRRPGRSGAGGDAAEPAREGARGGPGAPGAPEVPPPSPGRRRGAASPRRLVPLAVTSARALRTCSRPRSGTRRPGPPGQGLADRPRAHGGAAGERARRAPLSQGARPAAAGASRRGAPLSPPRPLTPAGRCPGPRGVGGPRPGRCGPPTRAPRAERLVGPARRDVARGARNSGAPSGAPRAEGGAAERGSPAAAPARP
ncbi:hypothetical protein VULLAG_LOCUS6391 [Vulpes lagopus]|uniref:translation initiation factor IF-2-like n=1 Tax=Vulpes lagopus TaxID=494514 RepID=UPI001BC98A8E|nr:translation initiation factor IF-2-like [Vulpes lagopus]